VFFTYSFLTAILETKMERTDDDLEVSQCGMCQSKSITDYLPLVSTPIGLGKFACGTVKAAFFGIAAGWCRTRAQWADCRKQEEKVKEWNGYAQNYCAVATADLSWAGRGLVSSVPVGGNVVLLIKDDPCHVLWNRPTAASASLPSSESETVRESESQESDPQTEWKGEVNAFFGAFSVGHPPPDFEARARALLESFRVKQLRGCSEECVQGYREVVGYLLEESPTRLELLCDQFRPESQTRVLGQGELEEIIRLLDQIDCRWWPIGNAVQLCLDFAKEDLDPRTSDQFLCKPLVNAVKLNCGNEPAHRVSEAVIKQSVGSIGQCPICRRALPPRNTHQPDLKMRQLEREYGRLRG
jgi:hypothetical protein